MPQIAQQDYLFIDIGEYGLDEITSDDVVSIIKPILNEKFKAGTLYDCVIRNDAGEFTKVVSAKLGEDGQLFSVSFIIEDVAEQLMLV